MIDTKIKAWALLVSALMVYPTSINAELDIEAEWTSYSQEQSTQSIIKVWEVEVIDKSHIIIELDTKKNISNESSIRLFEDIEIAYSDNSIEVIWGVNDWLYNLFDTNNSTIDIDFEITNWYITLLWEYDFIEKIELEDNLIRLNFNLDSQEFNFSMIKELRVLDMFFDWNYIYISIDSNDNVISWKNYFLVLENILDNNLERLETNETVINFTSWNLSNIIDDITLEDELSDLFEEVIIDENILDNDHYLESQDRDEEVNYLEEDFSQDYIIESNESIFEDELNYEDEISLNAADDEYRDISEIALEADKTPDTWAEVIVLMLLTLLTLLTLSYIKDYRKS